MVLAPSQHCGGGASAAFSLIVRAPAAAPPRALPSAGLLRSFGPGSCDAKRPGTPAEARAWRAAPSSFPDRTPTCAPHPAGVLALLEVHLEAAYVRLSAETSGETHTEPRPDCPSDMVRCVTLTLPFSKCDDPSREGLSASPAASWPARALLRDIIGYSACAAFLPRALPLQ